MLTIAFCLDLDLSGECASSIFFLLLILMSSCLARLSCSSRMLYMSSCLCSSFSDEFGSLSRSILSPATRMLKIEPPPRSLRCTEASCVLEKSCAFTALLADWESYLWLIDFVNESSFLADSIALGCFKLIPPNLTVFSAFFFSILTFV
jgi:hypothetical protein